MSELACPTCGKHRGEKNLRKFRPRIPPSWPQWSRRRAAVEEAGDGFCAMCDLPIPLKANGKRRGKFTCGRTECRAAWRNVASMDCREAKARVERAA